MDIPYTVTPRKDTGLYNAKVGIWLFLASEVMLFGGLFSGYVFLRVYADFPWPERALPVVPGLINTFILIFSSVTIVFAWAALKMRKWGQFQIYMVITLLCAGLFMILKGFEYNAKLNHQAVRMNDFVVVEGHTHKFTIDSGGKIEAYHPEGHGDSHSEGGDDGHAANQLGSDGRLFVSSKEEDSAEAPAADHGEHSVSKKAPVSSNQIVFIADQVTIDLERFYDPTIRDLMAQAKERGSEIKASATLKGRDDPKAQESSLVNEGDPLKLGLLKKLRAVHLAAKANNAVVRTKQSRDAWSRLRGSLPKEMRKEPSYKFKDQLELNPEFEDFLVKAPSSVTFRIEPKVTFVLKPRDVREGPSSASFMDGTLLAGEMDQKHSQIEMAADAIDFRFVAQRAEEKGVDPLVAIENTWLMKHNPEVKKLWGMHLEYIAKHERTLLEHYGLGRDGKAKRVPTDTERYRIGWQSLVNMGAGDESMGVFSGFTGPDHKQDYAKHFPEIVVPREEVNLESKFTPRWNNYYAIYFLITGLHGLHVIGGIIVLGYFLLFGKKMYLNDPERLVNRVEVGGLFWHFVDLVWIFLFPILYLM